jgi:hypothetical protein
MHRILFSAPGRTVVAALLALYVPLFALFVYIGTLRYLILLPVFLYGPPVCLALLAMCVAFSPRYVRVMSWVNVAILALWLAQAFILTAHYVVVSRQSQGAAWITALAEGLREGAVQLVWAPYVVLAFIVTASLAWASSYEPRVSVV